MNSLARLLDHDSTALEGQISGLVAARAAIALSGTTDGNLERLGRSKARLAAYLVGLFFLADITGRKETIDQARALGARIPESSTRIGLPTLIRFPATASVQAAAAKDVLSREPAIVIRATEIAKVYEERGQAAARSADIEASKAVQRSITRQTARGEEEIKPNDVSVDLAGWTEQYAETVHDTGVSSSYAAGQMAQAKVPEIQRVAGAFELIGIDDAVIRRGRKKDRGEDHLHGLGLIAGINDPIWAFAGPPNGYGCRCSVRLVSWNQLQKAGLVVGGRVVLRKPANFDKFMPHPRFRGQSPDEQVYGTSAP